MSRWLKITLISVAIIFGLLLSTMVIVPWQVKKQGSNWIAENTDRTLTIEKVFFNPFTLMFEISGIKLTEQNSDHPFVAFKRLMFSISPKSVIRQAIILRRIELDDLFVNIELLGREDFNFSDFTRMGSNDSEDITAEEKDPLYFSFNNIVLTNGSIDFTDQTSEDKTRHQIRKLDLSIPVVGNIPYLIENYVEPKLSMLLNNAEFRATGELKPFKNSHETKLSLTLAGADLAYYAEHSPIPLPVEVREGTLDLKIDLSYRISENAEPQLLFGGEVALSDIDLRELGGRELLRMSALSIAGASFDLQQRQVNLGTIQLSNGDIKVIRLANGRLSLLQQQPVAESAEPESNSKGGEPWKIGAESVDLENFKFLLTDLTLAKKPQFKIHDFNFHVENFSYPSAEKSPFSLAAKVRKKGSIKINGTVVNTPLQLHAQTLIDSFPLAFLNNFVPAGVNIELNDGKLYSALAINLREKEGKIDGGFSGKLNVSNFDLRDPIGDGAILVWNNLELDDIKGTLDPFSFHVKDIVLSDYLANIRVTRKGRVNLTSITATELKTAAKEGNSAPSSMTETVITEEPIPAEPEPLPDIQIGTLTLQGGTVSFVDRHLSSIFSTTLYELGGRVSGLSSAEEMRADVDLRGQLENHSPLTIRGEINPLGRHLFADLTLSFKDIDLTSLSPYSGTYLGYVIDRGKLYLDLNYHIEDQIVIAENRLMIDQFTFGESVESDQATSLPVAFAIALLKDNRGEIHLDIPVSGDLSDPNFSVGGVIFTVLKNLVIKAATSPFSLLSSMLGGDEDFTEITFASGLTKVDEAQLIKFTKLAGMLASRPGLILEISGFADKEKDPEGYQQERLRQLLVAVKLKKMDDEGKPSETEEKVIISAEEYSDILLQVYKDADFPRPRNLVGGLKKLPDTEMEKLILANIVVGDEQLQNLANTRAMVVRDALVSENGEIKSRLFLQKVDIYQLPEGGPASRVEFNISSK